MTLSEILTRELGEEAAEPNVLIYVDNSSYYWVSKDGYHVWLQDHSGMDEFLDDNHSIEEIRHRRPDQTGLAGTSFRDYFDAVGKTGVYWMNTDFESPFHISDFLNRIEEINVTI